MRLKLAIHALCRKRAYLAGEIEVAEAKLAKQRATLAHLDATLRYLHPDADPEAIVDVRPVLRNLWFRHGEHVRYCREALRDAEGPLPTRLIIEYVMRAKSLDRDDRQLRAQIAEQTRTVMTKLVKRGDVQRVITGPETWWELAQ